jgi:hypothetical protein
MWVERLHALELSSIEGKAGTKRQEVFKKRQRTAEFLSSYLATYIKLLQEHKDLSTLHNALYPKPSRLLTVRASLSKALGLEALIDEGLQLNLLSATLAKEQDL